MEDGVLKGLRREPEGKNLVQRGILAHASSRQGEIDVP